MCERLLPRANTHIYYCCNSRTEGSTYSVLINDVDNGNKATLQGTCGGLGDATSLYESLERLQAHNIKNSYKYKFVPICGE